MGKGRKRQWYRRDYCGLLCSERRVDWPIPIALNPKRKEGLRKRLVKASVVNLFLSQSRVEVFWLPGSRSGSVAAIARDAPAKVGTWAFRARRQVFWRRDSFLFRRRGQLRRELGRFGRGGGGGWSNIVCNKINICARSALQRTVRANLGRCDIEKNVSQTKRFILLAAKLEFLRRQISADSWNFWQLLQNRPKWRHDICGSPAL